MVNGDSLAVAASLAELARLLEATGAPVYRSRAYERAARTLEALPPGDLARRIAADRLEELPWIGAALAHKIDTLARTGTLPELDALRSQVPSGFRELLRVEGLGPKRIVKLHRALGIDDLDDLGRALAEGRVRTVPGFSEAAERKLADALARARTRRDAHLWLTAVEEAERLGPRLARAGAHALGVAGAARRAHEEVDELSIVAVADAPGAAADAFVAQPGLVRASRDGTTVRAVTADGLPLVVRFASPEEAPAALVHATGPEAHVAALAARAAARGWSLGPGGLADASGRSVPSTDEAALYGCLGLDLVPPELRDDPDALGLAEVEGAFDDLVRVDDIRGVVHCHSTWSDGRNSIEELARACDARGIEYLTITDHSGTAAYAHGLDADRLRRQWDEIDRVQELVRVRLLKGTESDILADGALDFPDEVLARLDVVIASIHARHRMDPAAMTERLVRAMRHPLYKIWGHGLGRLVGRRDPIACDVERVLDVIAEGRAAIEINSDPHRLDLPPRWLRAARARGIRFVVSVDAHSVAGLSVLPFGVGLARRAGVRRDEVLNALTTDAFREAVRPGPRSEEAVGSREL